MTTAHYLYILNGAMWTVILSAAAFVGGTTLGSIVALLRVCPVRTVSAMTAVLVFIIQGTPPLVILFIFYFGVPAVGIPMTPFAAATTGLSIYAGVYLGETWQGSIRAVPKAQWEAAECLGLSRTRRMIQIIVPQALRISIPSTVGLLVQIIKATSLASILGYVDLMRSASVLNNSLFMPFRVYIIVALIYFAICFPLSHLSRKAESLYNAGR